MKKLTIMIWVLFSLSIGVYIYTLFSSIEIAVRMYRMTLLCNAGLFMPALSLIRKEKNNK